jgi:hypothetical protein
VKQSEAARIPVLLMARRPRPVVEEITIEGVRMTVIVGASVDTVIRHTRGRGADMPQLSSYPELAESAAHADERLAKQRASGRLNTTGEGVNWPRNWKLSAAAAAGKIWYAGDRDERNTRSATAIPHALQLAPARTADTHTEGSAETSGSWQWCAEDYLREIWWPQDRKLVRDFSGAVTCESLHNLCVLYRVARNIPGHGLQKYREFVDMLNGHRNDAMTTENVPNIIEQELSNMNQAYGRSFLSAITKAFWMMKQHPVAIYDSYAWEGLRRRGLAPGYYGYRAYYKAWLSFFERQDTQGGIEDALLWLPQSPFLRSLLENGALAAVEFKSLAGSMMLRNRIADRRLCYEGGVVNFK